MKDDMRPESHDADYDQVNPNDIVEYPRHYQDQDAGNERDKWLYGDYVKRHQAAFRTLMSNSSERASAGDQIRREVAAKHRIFTKLSRRGSPAIVVSCSGERKCQASRRRITRAGCHLLDLPGRIWRSQTASSKPMESFRRRRQQNRIRQQCV
jgi:hypothetical protein